tara:strand:+ start:318 stop:551 length:234 start_codon:yes stop_codon:yes gene_type:complete
MNTTKFKIGDWVQSAPDSDDIKFMKRIWCAQIYKIKSAKITPDGVCYETLGWWSGESLKKRPTLRQLWSKNLTRKNK